MRAREAVTVLILVLSSPLAIAQKMPLVEVWKSDSCGCCTEWVKHMQKNGFATKIHRVEDNSPVRRALGMPDRMASCHTAKVEGYVIEGHVPASDVRKLLAEKPKARGLAAPGMPQGSPGMDIPNSPPFHTYLVRSDGATQIYAKHEGPKGAVKDSMSCAATPDPAATGCGSATGKGGGAR